MVLNSNLFLSIIGNLMWADELTEQEYRQIQLTSSQICLVHHDGLLDLRHICMLFICYWRISRVCWLFTSANTPIRRV